MHHLPIKRPAARRESSPLAPETRPAWGPGAGDRGGLFVQAKLDVGPAGDRYEREADQVAARVSREVETGGGARAERGRDVRQSLPRVSSFAQRAAVPGAFSASPMIEEAIQRARGGGRPLEDGVREPMERAFGADLGGVRVHTGSAPDALNRSLSARAFTTGQDIFFREGEYRPATREGRAVLAHELTHTVQQGAAGPPIVQRLVGFEIEATNIPVTQPLGDDWDVLQIFLTFGVGLKQLPPEGEDWHRETDHGQIGWTIEAERKKWHNAANTHKDELEKQKGPGGSKTSNVGCVEYVTAPFNELRKTTTSGGPEEFGGRDRMKQALTEIAADIESLRGLTSSTKESGNLSIGIPPLDAWKAAATRYGVDVSFAEASRDRVVAQMKMDELYVQATMGVLPEKIQSFMKEAADKEKNPVAVSAEDPRMRDWQEPDKHKPDERPPLRAAHKMMKLVTQVMPNLVEVLTRKGGPLPTDNADEKAALAGYLTLVLQESLGSVLWHDEQNRIGGVAKNMVSFLSKTPLSDIPATLPAAVRTSKLGRGDDLFKTLVGRVHFAHKQIGEWLQKDYKSITKEHIEGAEESVLGSRPKEWIEDVLSGEGDRFAFAQLPDEDRRLAPENPKRGGRTGILLGDPKKTDDDAVATTRAIPLETRHYRALVPSGGLLGWAKEMVGLVKRAHA